MLLGAAVDGGMSCLFIGLANAVRTKTIRGEDMMSFVFAVMLSYTFGVVRQVLIDKKPSPTSKKDPKPSDDTSVDEGRTVGLPWEVFPSLWQNLLAFGATEALFLVLHYGQFTFQRTFTFCWASTIAIVYLLRVVQALFSCSVSIATIFDNLSNVAQILGTLVPLCAISIPVLLSGGSGNYSSLGHDVFSLPSRYAVQLVIALQGLMFVLNVQTWIRREFPLRRPLMCCVLGGFHIFALIGIWKLVTLSPSTPVSRRRIIGDIFVLYTMGGLGVTAGCHRLWAHRSYKANFPYRFMLMIFNSIAFQGNIIHWSQDHRLHHRYSEKEPDPHNANKGFFYAHVGWLLSKRPPAVVAGYDKVDVSDLWEDYAVRLQVVLDPWFSMFVSWILPTVYGYWAYGSFWLAFFTVTALRWVILLNATWCVNSVAHLWGAKPYNLNIGPVESFFTALVACGEGWHNWHHQYGFDYATSEHGALQQYNPTKVFIDFFAMIGWVWDRKRAVRLWEITKQKRAEQKRAALEALKDAKEVSSEASAAKTENEEDTDAAASSSSSLAANVVAASVASVETLKKLIPAGCYDVSVIRSTLYLLRDLIAIALVSSATALLWIWVSRTKAAALAGGASPPVLALLVFLEITLFAVYSLAQGTVMVGVWVAAYESEGGRFSRWKWLNGLVGVVLSIILLIPYQSRKTDDISSSKKSAAKDSPSAHLSHALYEDVFSVFNVWRWTTVSSVSLPLGGLSASVSIALLASLIRTFGWRSIACWYFGSWLVMNFWLLLYHHLLLVKVHRAFNEKHGVVGFGSQQEEDKKVLTTEEMINDVVATDGMVLGNVDDCGDDQMVDKYPDPISVDPHSISEMQRQAKTFLSAPLAPSTVDFFTREWLLSAVVVFERTVMHKKFLADGPLSDDVSSYVNVKVRFLVRLLLFLFGSLHHHLAQVNVMQSISLRIPHYHTKEAVRALRAYARAHQLLTDYASGKAKEL